MMNAMSMTTGSMKIDLVEKTNDVSVPIVHPMMKIKIAAYVVNDALRRFLSFV